MDSIGADELVIRVHSFVYHVSCFICIWCKRQLKKGDKFMLRGHQPICETDLIKENGHLTALSPYSTELMTATSILNRAPNHELSGYDLVNGHSPSMDNGPPVLASASQLTILQPASNASLTCHDTPPDHQYSPRTLTICDSPMVNNMKNDPPPPYSSSPSQNVSGCNAPSAMVPNNNNGSNISIKQDGRRGPKRPRTILTTAQRRAFKASFEISQKPCRKVCRNI